MAPNFATAREIREAFVSGTTRAIDICDAALARLESLDGAVRAFLAINADGARTRAHELDRMPNRSLAGPLAAVPVAIKDNLCTAGLATTAGSRILEGFVPPYDATAVERLTMAGALIIGKTNCDEFAMGSSTEFSAFGATRNPWDLARTPGGSSGGSAAAVAARVVPIALGSDTGGSVRQPASLCGVVAIKPTYGRVSRYGLIAFASSLDQVGTFGLTVDDAAYGLEAIAGYDSRDATSAREPVASWAGIGAGSLHGTTLGVPVRWLEQGVDAAVLARFEDALDVFRSRGAKVIEIDLPHAHHAIPVYYVIATAEASSNLARYDGVRYGVRDTTAETLAGMYARTRERGFGAEVKRRIMLGTYVLSAGYYDQLYVKAQQVRTLISRDYDDALQRVDAVVTPTSPTTAFPLGSRLDNPMQMYLSDVFTAGAPLAGLPAISIPCGFDDATLPVGFQLVGRRFDEAMLFRIGRAYEDEQPWWRRTPPGLSMSAR
jgi:aspartyl-tRNA(Asn)/glutamyl-tRNA(Gln) amidotransferase subunit A